jgi:hypothetical protein
MYHQTSTEELWQLLEDAGCLVADGLDEAVIGITYGPEPQRAVYDIDQVIDILCRDEDMDRMDAIEHFEYNIAGSYVGEKTPVFVFCSEQNDYLVGEEDNG